MRNFPNPYKDFEGDVGTCNYVRNLIPQVLQLIEKNCLPLRRNADGGLYVGVAGIAYAFYYVAEHQEFANKRQEYLQKAQQYIQAGLQECEHVNPKQGGIGASFLLGHAGVFAVASLIFNALGNFQESDKYLQYFIKMHEICKPVDFFKHGSDELLVGRSGYLCASLFLNKKYGQAVVPHEVTRPLFDAVVESGRRYSKKHHSKSPLMYSYYSTEYLGAAHGLCSILHILLCFPEHMDGRSDVVASIKESVDFVLSCEQPNGNFPPCPGEQRAESHELVHWCHGAPGVVYLLAKAYLVWKEEKYLHAVIRCGDVVWSKGLLRKGPGICHGVAGNGYVFLLLFRLTGHQKYLYRAHKFCDFIRSQEFQQGARTPDAPYSLFEGLAGTICFYGDILQPALAAFPFFDILE